MFLSLDALTWLTPDGDEELEEDGEAAVDEDEGEAE